VPSKDQCRDILVRSSNIGCSALTPIALGIEIFVIDE
jgi:hypothetical protein